MDHDDPDQPATDWTPPERPRIRPAPFPTTIGNAREAADHDPRRFDPDAPTTFGVVEGIGWPPPGARRGSDHLPLPADLPVQQQVERLLVNADELADRCAELIRDMRPLGYLASITGQLTEAHGQLVTVANSLARAR